MCLECRNLGSRLCSLILNPFNTGPIRIHTGCDREAKCLSPEVGEALGPELQRKCTSQLCVATFTRSCGVSAEANTLIVSEDSDALISTVDSVTV